MLLAGVLRRVLHVGDITIEDADGRVTIRSNSSGNGAGSGVGSVYQAKLVDGSRYLLRMISPGERIESESTATLATQLYVGPKEQARLNKIAEGLVLTVDSTVPYNREFDIRNGVTMPVRLTPRNIADIATYAWYGNLVLNNQYEAAEFLDVASYTNVVRWASEIQERPAVQRGRRVNKTSGPEELRVLERHDASDIS